MRPARARSPCAAPMPSPSRCSWPTTSSERRAGASARRAARPRGDGAAGPRVRRLEELVLARVCVARRGPRRRPRATYDLPMADEDATSRPSRRAAARLIRFDTVNPPGDERAAQELLEGCWSAAGFECELRRRARPSARTSSRALRGAEPTGPCSACSRHVDTVLADAGRVARDPWWRRGRRRLRLGPRRARHEVPDRGRGRRGRARSRARAGARRAATCCRRRSSTRRPAASTARSGSARSTPTLVRCDYLLNEGGGAVIPFGGRRLYGVCVRREGRLPLPRPRARRRRATPRCPAMGDNALLKLAPLLERAAARGRAELRRHRGAARLLRGLGEDPADPAPRCERSRATDPRLAPIARADARRDVRADDGIGAGRRST